jgi:Flp pilus assembly protein TadD
VSAPAARVGLLVAAAMAATALGGCAHFVVLRDPLTASEHNDLGVAYEASGQPSLAAKEYRSSLRLDAHAGRAWVNLGNVQAAEGRWRAAERSYRQALRVTPNDADAMNNLAVALLRRGRDRDEARAWAERAVATGGERDSVYRATLVEVGRGGP